MTIGFGDFVPGNYYIYNIDQNISSREANAKIILGSLYILFGMGLIGMCINLMQEKIFLKVGRIIYCILFLITGYYYFKIRQIGQNLGLITNYGPIEDEN